MIGSWFNRLPSLLFSHFVIEAAALSKERSQRIGVVALPFALMINRNFLPRFVVSSGSTDGQLPLFLSKKETPLFTGLVCRPLFSLPRK